MKCLLFDIEADALLQDVTKIHCMSYSIVDIEENTATPVRTVHDKEDIKTVFSLKYEYIAGHNIVVYDLPVLKKIYDIEINYTNCFDTFALSCALYPHRKRHGLKSYGEEYKSEKVKVDDWSTNDMDLYTKRCERDVEINLTLFWDEWEYLNDIYDNKTSFIGSYIKYLSFKMDCLRDQEEVGIPMNKEKCMENLEKLIPLAEEKTALLREKMPKENAKLIKSKPKKLYKKDGSLSSHGENWFQLLKSLNLPEDTEEVREAPNPNSDTQLKKWLFSLGWKPDTWGESKVDGHKIPKISLSFGRGISKSVKKLYEKEPVLEELDNYYKIQHRIGVLNSFLDGFSEKTGKIYARASGLTKTLRLTHTKPFVNLPKPGVFFGAEIRSVMEVPSDEYIMCGSDVSSLEDKCKQHFIYFYDPEYVKQMAIPGFDPHLDLGILAGLITEEESDFYKKVEEMSDSEKRNLNKEDTKFYKSVKKKRSISKTTNYAATYGAGGSKIAETAEVPLEDGIKLFNTYWKRNWAVKKIAQMCKVKTVYRKLKSWEPKYVGEEIVNELKVYKVPEKWLFNPISGFWIYLSSDKDRFSALNQNKNIVLNKLV